MLSLHRTLRDIDPNEWNRLAGENPFATHGWLLTVESCWRNKLEPSYFTLRQDGVVVAASVCYVASATTDAETLDDMLFGRLARPARSFGLSFLPAFICGPALGYGWHIGVDQRLSSADQDMVRGMVLDAIEAESRNLGLQLHFVHLLDTENTLQNLLRERGYLRCRNAPVAVLDVNWDSFEDYLSDLPARRRREFRRQIRRNREAGNAISLVESVPDDESRLLELVDNNARKHNTYPFAFGPGFFHELKRNLGAEAWIFTSRRSGVIMGVSGSVVEGDNAYAFVVGVDHGIAGNDYTYFQLLYYSLIAHAIESGTRHIFYGRGMYEIKLRRGCRLTDTWIYSREAAPRRQASASWFALASFWNRYKLPREARRALGSRL